MLGTILRSCGRVSHSLFSLQPTWEISPLQLSADPDGGLSRDLPLHQERCSRPRPPRPGGRRHQGGRPGDVHRPRLLPQVRSPPGRNNSLTQNLFLSQRNEKTKKIEKNPHPRWYLQAQRERAAGAAAADGGAAAAGRRDQQLPAPAGAGQRAAAQAQDHEGQQGDHEEEAGAGHLHREYSAVQCSAVQYSAVGSDAFLVHFDNI